MEVIFKRNMESAKYVGEFQGVQYYAVGNFVGKRIPQPHRYKQVGTVLGYSYTNKTYLIRRDNGDLASIDELVL